MHTVEGVAFSINPTEFHVFLTIGRDYGHGAKIKCIGFHWYFANRASLDSYAGPNGEVDSSSLIEIINYQLETQLLLGPSLPITEYNEIIAIYDESRNMIYTFITE